MFTCQYHYKYFLNKLLFNTIICSTRFQLSRLTQNVFATFYRHQRDSPFYLISILLRRLFELIFAHDRAKIVRLTLIGGKLAKSGLLLVIHKCQ
ncbi:hypothetical protein KsCSTR_31650 [Candidatus Kuenenia stuttgartiensis]|uniref:Uncharacterized protein n=1 Tax=Kuenenia stuttgartiensis TaxID=174633 RepID=Q1Q4X0_KUEST|nr:hypothetical protein KsCSTR_31650 [Candidatus Kuenenia stuttgartiensis]CAJ75060.1 unknown protein [Candidatus Kuenenia stuttgartiensis]